MQTIGEFIGALFLARDVAHTAHLATKSYAKHKALNEFYDEIVQKADELAEAHQGKYGLIGKIPMQGASAKGDITDFLQAQVEEIELTRQKCVGNDTFLQNLVDEIVILYYTTLYKLRNLS